MIHHQKYLRIRLLLENLSKHPLKGVYRPQAYIAEAGSYCTECQFELFREPVEPGTTAVVYGVLYAPHGFGEYLHTGSLLTLRNGLDVEAKALVLDIPSR